MKKIAMPVALSMVLLGSSMACAEAPPAAAPAAAPAVAPAPAKPAGKAPLAKPVKKPVLKAGEMTPAFSVTDYKLEKAITSADLVKRAKVTMLVFFNTGCSSCLAELTEASATAKEINDKSKFNVYAIAVDKRGAKSVAAYDESNRFEVDYLLDPEFTVPPAFGFTYTPAMVIVDKSGKILEIEGGFNPSEDKGTIAKMIKAHVE